MFKFQSALPRQVQHYPINIVSISQDSMQMCFKARLEPRMLLTVIPTGNILSLD